MTVFGLSSEFFFARVGPDHSGAFHSVLLYFSCDFSHFTVRTIHLKLTLMDIGSKYRTGIPPPEWLTIKTICWRKIMVKNFHAQRFLEGKGLARLSVEAKARDLRVEETCSSDIGIQ